jgi:lipid II:glycine glycyltransferase (peptidoglycan interpeptide bridge formation enzyme)
VPADRDSLADLARWAGERGLSRLRVEPEAGPELVPLLRELGFRPSPQVQPQYTMVLKLESEEETIASFNRGTRYNVRLAAKRGVTVEEDTDAPEMARQAAASATRQGIRLPPASYYALLLELLPWCRTYVARVESEAVAAILVIHFDGRGYYMFSGANGSRRELKPVYAAQWEAIRAAIREGCRDYDLWGVPPGPDRTHPWFGLWEFKSGFNGELVEYAGCWDLVLGELRHSVTEASEHARRRLGRLLRRGG